MLGTIVPNSVVTLGSSNVKWPSPHCSVPPDFKFYCVYDPEHDYWDIRHPEHDLILIGHSQVTRMRVYGEHSIILESPLLDVEEETHEQEVIRRLDNLEKMLVALMKGIGLHHD